MDKRRTSGLVPYIWKNGELLVFLQKRDVNAPVLADQFAFFGGGLDGDETPEQALLRETQEELEYTPRDFTYLGQYETFMPIDRALTEIELADTYRSALADLKKKLQPA